MDPLFGKGFCELQRLQKWGTSGKLVMVKELDSRKICGLVVVAWQFNIGIYTQLSMSKVAL
jgi:hypothetical protein